MMRRERAQEEDVTGNDEDEGRGGGYDMMYIKHRPKNGGNAGHGKKNENCTQQHLQTSAAW